MVVGIIIVALVASEFILTSLLLTGPVGLIFGLIAGVVFFRAGLDKANVDVGWKGILLVNEKMTMEDRFNNWLPSILDEGDHWIFPWFMDVILVSVQKQSKNTATEIMVTYNETRSDAKGYNPEAGSGSLKIKVGASIEFYAVHPFRQQRIAPGITEDDVEDVLVAALLRYTASTTPDRLFDSAELLGKEVLASEDQVKQLQHHNGVIVVRVNILSIVPVTDKATEALEQRLIESQQRTAQTIEAEALRVNAKADHLEIEGLSEREAYMARLAHQGYINAHWYVGLERTSVMLPLQGE